MAYDKVVDSAVLDAGLKQIADAIREKGGTEDTLAFPQAMADAIAAIEISSAKIARGYVTPVEDGTITIEHNLGKEAQFFAIVATSKVTVNFGMQSFVVTERNSRMSNSGCGAAYYYKSAYQPIILVTSSTRKNLSTQIPLSDGTSMTIGYEQLVAQGGIQYAWVAGVIE